MSTSSSFEDLFKLPDAAKVHASRSDDSSDEFVILPEIESASRVPLFNQRGLERDTTHSSPCPQGLFARRAPAPEATAVVEDASCQTGSPRTPPMIASDANPGPDPTCTMPPLCRPCGHAVRSRWPRPGPRSEAILEAKDAEPRARVPSRSASLPAVSAKGASPPTPVSRAPSSRGGVFFSLRVEDSDDASREGSLAGGAAPAAAPRSDEDVVVGGGGLGLGAELRARWRALRPLTPPQLLSLGLLLLVPANLVVLDLLCLRGWRRALVFAEPRPPAVSSLAVLLLWLLLPNGLLARALLGGRAGPSLWGRLKRAWRDAQAVEGHLEFAYWICAQTLASYVACRERRA